jgi:hypothetical protein
LVALAPRCVESGCKRRQPFPHQQGVAGYLDGAARYASPLARDHTATRFGRKYGRDGHGGKPDSASFRPIEDYTNKYKGEQVDVALFGGEYQEGVLTAYCYVEDVAHIELNGHILIPLQNIASLHCSSRCDAPDDDWPPRGLEQEDGQ